MRVGRLVQISDAEGPQTVVTQGAAMGTDDKIENKTEELTGKAKESVGDATDNPDLEAEGQADQNKGGLKQAGEKVKDAFKN
jgi:uncharacterized protein YjbJ (UPF0337 family)